MFEASTMFEAPGVPGKGQTDQHVADVGQLKKRLVLPTRLLHAFVEVCGICLANSSRTDVAA